MPIHDQGYRRYGGRRRRTGTRLDGHRPRRHPDASSRSGRFSACCCCRGCRSSSAPCRSTPSANLPQAASCSRRRRRLFRQFLEQQEIFVFFVTVYVGAGLIANDRRANALQIYLSKPLTRAEYIFGKLAILMAFLLLVTWVPAHAAPDRADRVRRQLHVSACTTCICSRRSRVFSFIQVMMVAAAMLALSSLSKSSRYVGILYAARASSSSQAIYGVLTVVTRSSQHVVDLVPGEPRAAGRRDLPAAAEVRHAVAGRAADDRRR